MNLYKVIKSGKDVNSISGVEGRSCGDVIKVYTLQEAMILEPERKDIFRSLWVSEDSFRSLAGFTPHYISKKLTPVYKTDVRVFNK